MTREELITVTQQMRLVMTPFVTPFVRDDDDGPTHIGSGGYVDFSGRKLALTNDHVVRQGAGGLTHKFYDSDTYFRFPKAFASEMFPVDLAASPVDAAWLATSHSAMTFPDHRMATRHAPLPGEYLFLLGFAGSGAYYSPTLNVIVTNGTPYLTQEFDPRVEEREITSSEYDSRFHFAMLWEPERTEIVDKEQNSVTVNPKGFSGALVWNTRFIEYTSVGKIWDPNAAQLTGIVWGWPQPDRVLLATRIEHVRTFLARIP